MLVRRLLGLHPRAQELLLEAALILALTALALLFPGAAGAAKPLHPAPYASHGKRVAALQWLLGGHRPSVYSWRTYYKPPSGEYGKRTAKAVLDAKWRLGYPRRYVTRTAGAQLLEFMLGKRARPLEWIGRSAARARNIKRHTKSTSCAARAVKLARSQLGVHEMPLGSHSNDGPGVRVFQSVTGAYRAPWCASFVQWVYRSAGVGTIADRSASVFYIVDWAHRRSLLFARPRVGAAVAFLRNLGHIGIVTSLDRTGFWTVEGNSGDAVRAHHYPFGYARSVFVYPPCLGRAVAAR